MKCSTDPDLDVKRSAMKKTVRHLIFLHGLLQSVLAVFPCLLGPKEGRFPLCWGPKERWSLFSLSVFVGAKRGVVSVFPYVCWVQKRGVLPCVGANRGVLTVFPSVFVGAKRAVFTVLPCLCLLGPKEGCSVFYPVCVCWGQKRGVHCFTMSVFVGAKRGVFTVLPLSLIHI